MNTHGRVPVIDDDGVVVWESQTILRYLAARDPAARFWSADAASRSQAERPFLGGEALSLADIPAGTALYRYFGLEIDRPSVPNVEAWYHRPQARPAYTAHVMIPFDELKGRLDP